MADVTMSTAELDRYRAQAVEMEAAEQRGDLNAEQSASLRSLRATLVGIDARAAAGPGQVAGQVAGPEMEHTPATDAALLVGARPDSMGRLAPELAAARDRQMARQLKQSAARHMGLLGR